MDDALKMVADHREGRETPLSPGCERRVFVKGEPENRSTEAPIGKPAEAPMDAPYDLIKTTPDFTDKLKAVCKSLWLFAGLSILFFYWWQTGQLTEEAAYPAIVVCTLLAGVGIGKAVR